MINYIFITKYITNISVFNSDTYEDCAFTNFKDAHKKMLKIVEDEERKSSDIDFYHYYIEIEKKAIDVFNPWDYDTEYWYYDMIGKEIHHMNNSKVQRICHNETIKFKKGDIVSIKPYPWNKCTGIPVEVKGVIADIPNDKQYEYIVYIFDTKDNRFFHSHEFNTAMSKIYDITNIDINLKLVSKAVTENLQIENEILETILCNGNILATTKKRLIDLLSLDDRGRT